MPLCWEHHGNRAVREGKWKLIHRTDDNIYELYDLSTDFSEAKDVVRDNPEIRDKLAAKLKEWVNSTTAKNPGAK